MFDIAWSELMVIAVIALVVIGPKDLPKAIYTLGKWVKKARLVARDFQGHIDDMMREAELDELRKEALKVRDTNLQKMVENTIDPKGELKGAFDVGANLGADGYHGSPPEDGPASVPPVGSPQVTAAQPQPATEPPVTAPLPPAPPAEFVPAPAQPPVPASADSAAAATTNKQA
ncbi:twin-arginine translocase subunit TatB [Azospirillum brasilense]|uniref:Sec-independent protein translocase protein TatB n=1 Tax=Azospirillum brasilense TaxID=192 RepID=A0A0P0EDM0_AZOBR|nr:MULTISPECIES: Sec-independent protein translocase protein TatB [Azospirillum]ALJ37161.1 preprotein translocase subunit TatB [Azospirillum brasilense]MDW7551862.1 Sec-independent protein translocase protein TatB [Azospirillum brasilense]MDW7591297.1 Sec-independent protein translocase protein TatB [Azospirillum brasilense]MDW7626467.1 Sec-independent protein translocase protein TatB [Azospirillum brasilense]MDX5951184.1 Sec-independent protein translocase protein TatB [Azospirillum brasilens